MNTIFEKKFNDNFPKRDFQHKLNIFLTCIWGLNLASSLSRGVIFLIVCHVICVLCWGIQWYFCAKKYNQKVDDYKKEMAKKLHEKEMENAFNFNYIKK